MVEVDITLYTTQPPPQVTGGCVAVYAAAFGQRRTPNCPPTPNCCASALTGTAAETDSSSRWLPIRTTV